MSNSIFDLLGENQGPQGGLSGLAVALQQGQQPQGLRQGLGAGLLNLSGFAEQALPSAIQGGFGPAALTGFLSSVGAPARQAAGQEAERGKMRQGLQLEFLKEAFPKLSSAGKTEMMKRLGLNLQFPEEEGKERDPSAAMKEIITTLGTMAGKGNASAIDALVELAPEDVGGALKGLTFFQGDDPDAVKLTAAQIFENYTTESATAFFDKTSKKYMVMSGLVPRPDKVTPGTKDDPFKLQAINDWGNIQRTAAETGQTIDATVSGYFKDNSPAYANFQKHTGYGVGATPPSDFETNLRVLDSISRMGIGNSLKDPDQLIPVVKDTVAKLRDMSAGAAIPFPESKVGARNPASIKQTQAAPAFPGPVAPPAQVKPSVAATPESLTAGLPPNQAVEADAMYRAAQELGVDLVGATSWPLLLAKLQTLPPEQIQKIKARGQALIKQDENTEATD